MPSWYLVSYCCRRAIINLKDWEITMWLMFAVTIFRRGNLSEPVKNKVTHWIEIKSL